MLQRIEALFQKPRAPLYLAVLGVMICLPALFNEMQADDFLFPWMLEQNAPPWALFEMAADQVADARAQGFLVWWSSPALHAKFLRPLASLSHALDFTLWPRAVWWMRLANALIYGASVGVAALLYRRLAPSLAVAGLAGLLFALDDGHAFSAGWIAGRNTLLAALFALLALWCHTRARDQKSFAWQLASAGSTALALASAEAGVWSLCLLASYAITMEAGSLPARLRTLSPQLAVALLWVAAYVALDCGFRGSSFYRDPSAPLAMLGQGMLDLPIWFADMFGPGSMAFPLLYPALWVRLGALLVALPLLFLLWPALKASAECRFFALAFALCLLPVLFTLPTSRVLLGASFGGLGWIACSIELARAEHAPERSARKAWTRRTLLGLHVVLAGLLFVPTLGSTQPFANGTTRIIAKLEPGRDVILVQAPVELLNHYALLATGVRSYTGPVPRSLHPLYAGASALWAERVDAFTLDLEVARGWGYVPMERIFGAPEDAPRAGSERSVASFRARVLESTGEGMPRRVRFTFRSPLEAQEHQWLTWQGSEVVTWTPPAIGQRVELAPLSFFEALLKRRF
jgi:hypothetical protein